MSNSTAGADIADEAVQGLVEELSKGASDEELKWLRNEVRTWSAGSLRKLRSLLNSLPEDQSAPIFAGIGVSPSAEQHSEKRIGAQPKKASASQERSA